MTEDFDQLKAQKDRIVREQAAALASGARKEPMSDRRTQGLYGKFEVRRTDGTDAPGGKHDGCTYFVLDLQHDKHMPAALRAYAGSCEKEYPVLASQLRIVANDFGSRAEFAGIMAQKPALDLERQQLAAAPPRPPAPPRVEGEEKHDDDLSRVPHGDSSASSSPPRKPLRAESDR